MSSSISRAADGARLPRLASPSNPFFAGAIQNFRPCVRCRDGECPNLTMNVHLARLCHFVARPSRLRVPAASRCRAIAKRPQRLCQHRDGAATRRPGHLLHAPLDRRDRLGHYEKADLAEGRGFEPPVGLPLLLISSQMPLTTQPPFQPRTESVPQPRRRRKRPANVQM